MIQLSKQNLPSINEYFKDLPPEVLLDWLNSVNIKFTLATSLGPQSIVLTHMLCEIKQNPDVFFIDTGRLPQETYDLLDTFIQRFNVDYRILFPKAEAVQNYVKLRGPNGFYTSVENRKLCCRIRKVEPLNRALNGYAAWVSGIRNEQTKNRLSSKKVEWDNKHQLFKFNPLLDWSEEAVWDYILTYDLPYNPLFDQGYRSIGCHPCTRPVTTDESGNDRSGRWWWEANSDKECGLHVEFNTIDQVSIPVKILDL